MWLESGSEDWQTGAKDRSDNSWDRSEQHCAPLSGSMLIRYCKFLHNLTAPITSSWRHSDEIATLFRLYELLAEYRAFLPRPGLAPLHRTTRRVSPHLHWRRISGVRRNRALRLAGDMGWHHAGRFTAGSTDICRHTPVWIRR